MRTRALLTGLAAVAATVLSAPLLPASAAPPPPSGAQPMIVGGHDATEDYSWMASLQHEGQHSCGASLIKPDWVVTAAHCVEGTQPEQLSLRIGSKDHSTGGTEAKVTKATVHPGYGTGNGNNDIAVLQLDKPVPNKPINIASDAGKPEDKTRIIGWGQTCPVKGCGEAPKNLQELDTKIVDPGGCQAGDIDGKTELCTGSDTPNANACFGDSGGPQLKGTPGNWELIGATSRLGSKEAECAKAPSIYTSVSAHADWVKQNTGG